MKPIFLLFTLALNCQLADCGEWRPKDSLLNAVRQVESNNGAFVVGDAGKSLGDYQLSEAAWLDVSNWRKSHGQPVYDYEKHVFNVGINRAYAADYLALLRQELLKKLKRPPTASELYAAYNMGMGTFAQCKFKVSRVNSATARKCQIVQSSVERRLAKN